MHPHLRQTLDFIARRPAVDDDLFADVAAFLCDLLDVDIALVGELAANGTSIDTVAAYGPEGPLAPLTYALSGTPCADVVDGAVCVHPAGVQQVFPSDELLQTLGVESYAGVPLRTHAGDAQGLIALLGPPLEHPAIVADVLQLIAVRCAHALEHLRAERRADAQQRTIDDAFEQAVVGMIRVSEEGRITHTNTALQSMLGYTADQLRGMSFLDITYPGDVEASRTRQAGARAQKAESTGQILKRYRHHDGHAVHALMSYRWVHAAEGQSYGLGQVVDVTALHQSLQHQSVLIDRLGALRERLDNAFEFAAVGMLLLAADGTILQTNQVMQELVGYTADELQTMSFCDLLPPDAIDEACALFDTHAKAPPQGHHTHAGQCRHSDGHLIDVLTSYRWERPTEGSPIVVCQVTDVSALREAERGRAALLDRLGQANKLESLGALAGGVAHDFNNVLAAILGYSALAGEEPGVPAPVRDSLHQIDQAARRGRDLVQQILRFVRTRSDAPRQAIHLTDLLEEAANMLEALLPRRAHLRLDVASDLPPIVGDATQLLQVLLNLCTNAAHALPTSGGTIEVGVRREGDHMVLVVADDGSGMPDEVRRRIFEPFFTTKPLGRGTGMGLSVVKNVIEAHHGTIDVASAPGEGTRFTLRLPVSTALRAPTSSTHASPRGARILVLDPNPAVTRMFARLLRRLGHVPTVCNDPVDAFAAYRGASPPFDLLITDQAMPSHTGTEVAAALRADRPDFPVILCSGLPTLWARDFPGKEHVACVLPKPFELAALHKALTIAIGPAAASSATG